MLLRTDALLSIGKEPNAGFNVRTYVKREGISRQLGYKDHFGCSHSEESSPFQLLPIHSHPLFFFRQWENDNLQEVSLCM